MKELYCVDDYESRARCVVRQKLAERRIPGNLMPNQNERAKRLLT